VVNDVLANSSVCRPASSQWFVVLPFDFILLSKILEAINSNSFFHHSNDGLMVVGEFMKLLWVQFMVPFKGKKCIIASFGCFLGLPS
jgi:hypothetical protein